jgi:alcohol dehydrogenase
MKTKAAVLHEMGKPTPYAETQPLVVEELELDPPGPGEVLVKIRAAGLCHSDLSVINGDRPRPTPMAIGHEAAGEVMEVGQGVNDLVAGDHVVMVFVPSCGHCQPCMEGRPALCEPGAAANGSGKLFSGESRLKLHGKSIHHHLGVSAFAEHAVVSRNSLVKIDKSLAWDIAALFGCAVLTGVGAVINTANVRAGSTVAVVGLGGVGLNAVLGAVLAGAARIVAIDVLEDKLALARQLGATDAVSALDPECVAKVKAMTNGGVDYGLEMAGSPQAMDTAYGVTRRGGTTVTAGLSHPDKKFAVQHVSLVAEERSVRGSYVGSCVPVRDVPRYISLYQQGRLPIDRLVGEHIGLAELNIAFDRLASGKVVRQILIPS